jgi:hypothetical protein
MVTFVCAASGPLEDKYQKILMLFKNKNLKLKNILNKFEIKKDSRLAVASPPWQTHTKPSKRRRAARTSITIPMLPPFWEMNCFA